MAFSSNRSASRFLNKGLRSTKFLNEMEKIIPRENIVDVIDNEIEETKKELWWRPRISTEKKLRMYFLSQRFNLSDILTEENIYDRLSFQHFMNVDVTVDQIPDSTTLCNFRHFLEEKKLWKKILEKVNDLLKEADILLTGWALIDATLIKAASSTKNAERKRDQEMSSTKKNGNRHFWAKAHIWTDTNWYIHEVHVTTAKVHDSQAYDNVIPAEADYSIWDSAYTGKPLQEVAEKKWIKHVAMKKRKRGQSRLWTAERLRNTLLSMPRKVVEFPFWVIKNIRGHRKTKYRWLEKMKTQRYVLCALCNAYRARHKIHKRRFW